MRAHLFHRDPVIYPVSRYLTLLSYQSRLFQYRALLKMADTVNPETIKKTQEMLGKYLKKPPLTNKLLGKPPFRYLHDIINSVINDTGFLKGLYELEELSSENIKDKEAKINFLQKSINATSIAVGINLSVRPSKIVAGHEVEQTNEWLQAIAKGIEKKINSESAVKQVLSEKKISKANPSKVENKKKEKLPQEKKERVKDESKPGTKRIVKKKPIKVPSSSQEKVPQKGTSQKGRSSKTEKTDKEKLTNTPKKISTENHTENIITSEYSTNRAKENDIDSTDINLNRHDEAVEKISQGAKFPLEQHNKMAPSNLLPTSPDISIRDGTYSTQAETKVEGKVDSRDSSSLVEPRNISDDISISPRPVPLPSTANNTHVITNNTSTKVHAPDIDSNNKTIHLVQSEKQSFTSNKERPITGKEKRPATARRSARPSSARPAPPKVREKRELQPDETTRPPSAKMISNVILDSGPKEDDSLNQDDASFTVGETNGLPLEDMEILNVQQSSDFSDKYSELLDDKDASKGLLVAQIIESKKELEDERRESFSPETPGHRRVLIDSGFGDLKAKKDNELIRKEIEDLNGKIQSLTRSVLPLAKMLDYLQEDLDSMHKEYDNWKEENKKLNQGLKTEQSKANSNLEPLKVQLEDSERAISDRHDRISAVKSNILRNDDRILTLLSAIKLR